MTKREHFTYAGVWLQAVHWTAFCSLYSFAAVFLKGMGIQSGGVGLILAVASLAAVFIQPATGAWIDRGPAKRLKFASKTIVGITLAATLVLIPLQSIAHLPSVGIYLISLIGIVILQPLFSALIIRLTDVGASVSFGIARAFGSLSFALGSSVIGVVVSETSAKSLPFITAGLLTLLFIIVSRFPEVKSTHDQPDVELENVFTESFFKKYRGFLEIVLGIAFVFVFHTVANVFLVRIIENAGGNETNFGFALTLMAAVEIPVMLFSKPLIARFGTVKLFTFAMVFYVVRSVALALAGNLMAIYFAQVLQAFCFALYIPISVAYVNERMHGQDKVKGQTAIVSATTLGGVIGSVGGGFIIDTFGVTQMLYGAAGSALIGAILVILGLYKKNNPLQFSKEALK